MRPTRAWLLTFLAATSAALLTADALARKAVVTTTDGRQLEGELLTDDDNGVTLEISGIRTPIPRAQVKDVQYKPGVEDEYKARRAKIDDGDFDGRYNLAYWLYNDAKAYDLALRELQDMAKRFPKEERVSLLIGAVERQIRIQQEQREQPAPTPTPDTPATPTPAPGATATPSDPAALADARLNDDQINIIRVYDVDLRSSANAVRVGRDTVEEFLQRYQSEDPALRTKDNQNAFRRASAADQLRKVFQHKARDLYPAFTVNDDPPQMRLFKQNVHTGYVLSYCGTANCHGSDQAPGGYYVFRVQPRDNRTIYSNYLTLYRMETPKGFMVDVERPSDSLVLQYGMRPEAAKTPHPQVQGWKPAILSAQAPEYRNLLTWIESFNRVRQTYPIDYTPPGSAAATQPAEEAPTPPAR